MNFYKNFDNKSTIIFLILFIIFVFLSYQPILSGYYLFTDDYHLVYPKIGSDQSNFFISNYEHLYNFFIKSYSRPLTYYYAILLNKLILDPSDAYFFRLSSILIIITIGIFLIRILRNLNITLFHSCCLSFLIISTPSFLIHSYWLILMPSLFSILFSILAYELLREFIFSQKQFYKIFVASFFILLSLLAYQQTSTFFLLLAFLPLINSFFNKKNIDLEIFFYKISTYFITFFLHLLILYYYYDSKPRGFEYHLQLIYYKFLWLINEIIPLSINFIYFNSSFFYLLFLLIIIFIYSNKIYLSFKKKLNFIFYFSCFLFFCSMLFFFPALIAKYYFTSSHRIIIVLSSFYLIIFYFLFKRILSNKNLSYLLFVVCLFTFLKSFYFLKFYVSIPQSKEYETIKLILKENLNDNIQNIIFIRPPRESRYLNINFPKGIEFGYLSSAIETNSNEMILTAIEDLKKNSKLFFSGDMKINSFGNNLNLHDSKLNQAKYLIIDFSNYPLFFKIK